MANTPDDLGRELNHIVKESGWAKEERPATPDPRSAISFVTGMDHEKYLVASHPGASEWKLFVRGAKGTEVAAEVVPPGEYLNAWHELGEKEAAWCVDSYLLPRDEDPKDIRIVIPSREEPLVLPHPSRGR
jgi:hypothetical protein